MSFKALRVSRVVQAGSLKWSDSDTFDNVETLDAGPSLLDWLRINLVAPNGSVCEHPFASPEALLLVVRGLMLALHEIHSAGFVHCDLREANVCLAFSKHPTQIGAFTPDWNSLKLIDFAFSTSKNHRLQVPLPISPRAHLHSAAFIKALDADNASGKPRCVQKLDWRIDLFALGTMLERLFEKLRPQWPVDNHQQTTDYVGVVEKLITDLKAQDSTEHTQPDLKLHNSLLKPVDELLTKMGTPPTPAFVIHPLSKTVKNTSINTRDAISECEVRPTPLVNVQAANTPLVPATKSTVPIQSNKTSTSPPQTVSRNTRTSPTLSTYPLSRTTTSTRVMLPDPPKLGGLAAFWHKLVDSVALERYRYSAAKGNAIAAYKVGCILLRGYASKSDPALALQWLLVAANAGHAAAQAVVGTMFDGGYGTTRDDAAAAHWYSQAAAQGNPTGNYGLGVLLSQGRGIRRDDATAVHYLRAAASADLPMAYSALGQLILAGRGVLRNLDDALECFRRAANLGDSAAAQMLGQFYEKPGAGSLSNPAESLKWYERAVKLGRSESTNDVQRIKQKFPQ